MNSKKHIQSRIDFLDLMRIFAFVSVLIGHKFYPTLAAWAQDPSLHITIRYFIEGIMPLCRGGAAGVVVFFFISGYIITHVLQKESPTDFLIKRAFRIYPLYIFAILTEMLFGWVAQGIALPSLSIIIPRLFLIGDFFDTNYALAGVEWTLRVEVLFYLFMAALKKAGLLSKPALLPIVYVACTALLSAAKPFPSFTAWSTGYLNLYGPFLLIGSLIYLCEHKLISRQYGTAAAGFIFISFLLLIAKIQPNWSNSNYALFAIILFTAAWCLREKLTCGPAARLLSELTYSVYLFHNWLWSYLNQLVERIGITLLPQGIQIVLALLLICYVTHIAIEKPGATLGRKVISKLRNKNGKDMPRSLAT